MPLDVRVHGSCVRVRVHVQPRASRTGLAGLHGDALKVRLAAPPVDGAANAALVGLLSDVFGVPRHAVRVVGGHAAREKVVELDGVDVAAVRRAAGER